jgi:hypothetical protein
MTARDDAALELATLAGDLVVPTADTVAEMTPERAILRSLARHLARIEARVENEGGAPTGLRFKTVSDRWPQGTAVATYPSATLLPVTSTEWATKIGQPVRDAQGRDVISDDGQQALWLLGEDTGLGCIHVFTTNEPHRGALRQAVQDALFGSIDRRKGIRLPLPEAFLPPAFQGLLDPFAFPRGYVAFDHSELVADDQAGASGMWRADLFFRWQAPRIAARSRLPDLRTEITVRVLPAGQEIPSP